jgi:hypothetical protein
LLRVNYYEPGRFDFGGGWGFSGSEIALPLSPTALLYAKIRHRNPFRFTFPPDAALTVQYLLARRAFHAIYSTQPMRIVESLRRRSVDDAQYRMYRQAFDEWHERQLEAEADSATT